MLAFRVGDDQDEEADDGQPETAQGAAQNGDPSEGDQQDAEDLPAARGGSLGAVPVSGTPPHQRLHHASAVERRGRQQIEHAQHEIHPSEPHQDSRGHRPAGQRVQRDAGPERRRADDQAGERPAHSHDEGRAGRAWLAHLGHPAQCPERDVLDLDALPPGRDRVGGLMSQQTPEKQQGPNQAGDRVCGVRLVRNPGGSVWLPRLYRKSTTSRGTVQWMRSGTRRTRPIRTELFITISCGLELAVLHPSRYALGASMEPDRHDVHPLTVSLDGGGWRRAWLSWV